MTQQFIFQGQKPKRLNLEVLRASVRGIAPEVKISFIEGVNWNAWPYTDRNKPKHLEKPSNVSAPYSQPDVLIFNNVPSEVSKAQIKAFIKNHLPTRSAEQVIEIQMADSLVNSMLKASTGQLLRLKNKLDSV